MARREFDVKMAPEASIAVVLLTLILGGAACGGGIVAHFVSNNDPGIPVQDSVQQALRCMYQKNIAKIVAFASALCLVGSHVIVAMLGGCVCCCSLVYASGKAHCYSMILFGIAWASFFVSIVCFMSGAYINDYHTSRTFLLYDYDLRRCFKVKGYVYIVGAASAFVTSLVDIMYYAQAQKAKFEAWVEQGAPTPRLFNTQSKKTFVIAGPAKRGPLKDLEAKRIQHRNNLGDEETGSLPRRSRDDKARTG